jgi:hypothetical protein
MANASPTASSAFWGNPADRPGRWRNRSYAGRAQDGLRTLLVNGALIWTVAALAREGYYPAAVVVGLIEVPFYTGNVRGAGASARALNRGRRSEHLARSLEAVAVSGAPPPGDSTIGRAP